MGWGDALRFRQGFLQGGMGAGNAFLGAMVPRRTNSPANSRVQGEVSCRGESRGKEAGEDRFARKTARGLSGLGCPVCAVVRRLRFKGTLYFVAPSPWSSVNAVQRKPPNRELLTL